MFSSLFASGEDELREKNEGILKRYREAYPEAKLPATIADFIEEHKFCYENYSGNFRSLLSFFCQAQINITDFKKIKSNKVRASIFLPMIASMLKFNYAEEALKQFNPGGVDRLKALFKEARLCAEEVTAEEFWEEIKSQRIFVERGLVFSAIQDTVCPPVVPAGMSTHGMAVREDDLDARRHGVTETHTVVYRGSAAAAKFKF